MDQNTTPNNQGTQPIAPYQQIPKRDNLIQENPTLQNPQTPKPPRKSKGLGKALLLVFGVVVIIAAIYLVGTSYLESQFFSSPEVVEELGNPSSGENIPVANTTQQQSQEDVVVDCPNLGVEIKQPNTNQVFSVGQTISLDWDLCGINPDLVDAVAIDYFASETAEFGGSVLGSVNIFCTESVEIKDSTTLQWTIPPYVESGTGNCLTQKDVDFSDNYLYKLRIVYANQQYQDSSDAFFSIDASQFVYQPPTFDEYSLESVADFSRASSVSDTAIDPLKEIIQLSFFATPATFANYYRDYTLGCGTGCLVGRFLIDLRDGEVYQTPMSSNQNISSFRSRTSRLLILEQSDDETIDYQSKDARVMWYEFSEEKKDFTLLDTKFCNVVISGDSRTYQDCIQP